MNKKIPICFDCKYCETPDDAYSYCIKKFLDPVDGSLEDIKRRCWDARRGSGRCGPSGLYFEKR